MCIFNTFFYYVKTHIEQYYKNIDYSFRYSFDRNDIDEIRLRKVNYADDIGYYYRVQSQLNDGTRKVFVEKNYVKVHLIIC